MTITNIIDVRKKPYRFMKINAVIEPAWHDNTCVDADQAERTLTDSWIGYEEREHVTLHEAVDWAEMHADDVTLYIYDQDGGLYAE